jgi:hypothetical protein
MLLWGTVALLLGSAPGCRSLRWWSQEEVECLCVTCGHAACPLMMLPSRRIFVVEPHPDDLVQGMFVRELIAELGKTNHCEVVLLPRPSPLYPGPPPVPEAMPVIDEQQWPPVHPLPDTFLVVELSELEPYRPMRLGARIELKEIHTGETVFQTIRTWQAPVDESPSPPGLANLKLLNRPRPPSLEERAEMTRLSPRTFMNHVAQELARTLLQEPLGPVVHGPG